MAVAELEDAARELGRDANLHTALWGTVEAGHFHVWVLHPDDQPRTQRTAEELLKRLLEVAVSLGGYCAPGNLLPFDSRTVSAHTRGSLGDTVREQLLKRCDPNAMYLPVRKTLTNDERGTMNDARRRRIIAAWGALTRRASSSV